MGTFKDPWYIFAGDSMDPKSILASKTLWINVAGFAVAYAHLLPPEWAALVVAIANVANRYLTNGPVKRLF